MHCSGICPPGRFPCVFRAWLQCCSLPLPGGIGTLWDPCFRSQMVIRNAREAQVQVKGVIPMPQGGHLFLQLRCLQHPPEPESVYIAST